MRAENVVYIRPAEMVGYCNPEYEREVELREYRSAKLARLDKIIELLKTLCATAE